jgi:hypothetical protein
MGTKNLWGKLLLIEVFAIVFFIGFLPLHRQAYSYSLLYTLLLFTSALNLDKHQKIMLRLAAVATILEWISTYFNMPILNAVSILSNTIFFMIIGASLIVQIARAKSISGRVILEAINGYLLLGIIFSLLIIITAQTDPEAYNFSSSENFRVNDCIYYGFVTLSTLGYGDLLPLTTFSRSLALFTTLGGQLYLAVIIALLVGKFSSQRKE